MSNTSNLDTTIEDKYGQSNYSLLQEFERIKLPVVYNQICSKARFRTISSRQSPWDIVKQSKLIESLIINIPVPPIITYKASEKDSVVIDGRERLKAIHKFYSNQLTLSGLEIRSSLNRSTYNTLPTRIKSLLNCRSLYVINIIFDSSFTPDKRARVIDVIAQRLGNERSTQAI